MVVSISVSSVPLSRSLTKAHAAEATEQIIGTDKNSSGQRYVVKTLSQAARGSVPSGMAAGSSTG